MEHNTFSPPTVKPNTIGSLYTQSERLKGLTGQYGEHTLRIDAFTFQWRQEPPERYRVDFQLRLTWAVGQAQDTIELRNGLFENDFVTGMDLPIDDGAFVRIERYLDTLAEQLSQQPHSPNQTTHPPRWPNTIDWPFFIIGVAQTPPAQDGLIDYLDANLFELMCPDTKIITTSRQHDYVWHIEAMCFELYKQTLSPHKYGLLSIRDIIRGPNAEIEQIYDTTIPLGYLDAELWPTPAPNNAQRQHIKWLAEQWRKHTETRAQQMMDTFDVDELVHYGFTKTCWHNDDKSFELMEMITHSIQYGRPPSAPTGQFVVEVSLIDASQCAPIDSRHHMETLFGLQIGEHTLIFCDDCCDAPQNNAHVYLHHAKHTHPTLILSSDIMSRTRLSADGHAYVMTVLLHACADHIKSTNEEPSFTFEYEDEDDEGDIIETQTTLKASAWLDLAQDGGTTQWVDWRVQSHIVRAGLPMRQTAEDITRYQNFLKDAFGAPFVDTAYAPGNHRIKVKTRRGN